MRRTYKSKKDTTGVLDHKDVLLTLDEKSSAFDAFYIQNIKQTKKEMSCLGASNHYGGAAKKVRNRKYVKRILKVEPVMRESLSNSVYMTPEKSIRVNKAQDLFDQLLNSSLVSRHEGSSSSKTDSTDKLHTNRVRKTYAVKTKKYNYSSSESDSEKENSVLSTVNISSNTTNINIQKLLIEKQDQPSSRDQSICNILEKLPQLNNIVRPRDSNNCRISFKPFRHRLTKNLNSTLLDNSPLCSTPFKEKYRSNSIYNFSPITHNKQDSSPDNVTHTNSSLEGNITGQINNEKSLELNCIQSPILQPNKSYDAKKNASKNSNVSQNKVNITNITKQCGESRDISTYVSLYTTPEKIELETTESRLFYGFLDPSCETKSSEQAIDDNLGTSTEIQVLDESHQIEKMHDHCSKLYASEMEPFLGFHNPSPARISRLEKICIEDSCLLDSSDESVQQITIQDQNNISHIENEDFNPARIQSVNENADEIMCKDEEHEARDMSIYRQIDNIVNDVNTYDSGNDLDRKGEIADTTAEDLQDSITSNYDKTNSPSESTFEVSDNDYDTCNSDQIESDEDKSEAKSLNKYPVVEIVRLKQSDLEKYYKLDNSGSCFFSDKQEKRLSDEFNVSTERQLIDGHFNESVTTSEDEGSNLETRNIQDNIVISSSDGDYVDSNSNDEDKYISFVTTRRKNEMLKNTSIFVLDNTIASPASSDCDKTVISIEKENNDDQKTDLNETSTNNKLDNKLLQEWNTLQMERKACKNKTNSRSSASSRKSVKRPKPSISHDVTLNSDIKDAIVLLPGKKWERSLSIYRRMTQMADHFDESNINDDEHKGRNYRQSVLSTMENQDIGSVHNVSISSRRSTILSKPSRSTVRLINDTSSSRLSTTSVFDDLKGFLHEDCDDTVIELSKLSLAESQREITIVESLDDCERGIHDARATTARDYVLRRCNQRDVILFDECYPETDLKNCHKIGEGVYGEVYLWRARDGRARVMKIIPIAGDTKVNGETQKGYEEVIAEIVIAMELSALRTPLSDIECCLEEGREVESLDLLSIVNATDVFNEVIGVRCVYGPYPSRLLDLWELYDEVKGSENDNPAILPPSQHYIVLELANAGQDLESYQFNNAEQAHALFWQVAFGLAVGEEAFQLEHRDLHWGNVLIAPTEQKLATFVLRGRIYRIPRCGVRGAVIDYSLSRVSLPLGETGTAALYNDLASDQSLFAAVGDYQFEVYRLMRDKLNNEWKNFEPSTNILWLHYIVDKMITALRYKRTNTKIHKHYIAKLKGIKNRILQYGSAGEFVLTDNEI